MYFDIFDGAPTLGGNYLRSESITADFSVRVADPSEAPEPGSFVSLAIGIAVVALLRFGSNEPQTGYPMFRLSAREDAKQSDHTRRWRSPVCSGKY